jgi:hypothetical protein
VGEARTEIDRYEYGYAACHIAPNVSPKPTNASVVLNAPIANVPAKTISIIKGLISARSLQEMRLSQLLGRDKLDA